jgi:hypothetical protein
MKSADLIARIKDAGLQPRAYSGRTMYGKYCVGVSLRGLYEADGLPLKGSRTDSLGMGIILYWPNVPAPEEL